MQTGEPRNPVQIKGGNLFAMLFELRPTKYYGEDVSVQTLIKDAPHYKFAKLILEAEAKGDDICFEDTDYYKYGMEAIKELGAGGFFGATDAEGMLNRCRDFRDLILDIKKHGVNFPVMIHKGDQDGAYVIRDGHHRAAAIIALGVEDFEVDEHEQTYAEFWKMNRIKHFDDLLINVINKGKSEKYQPLPDGFGEGLKLGRECTDRLEMMRAMLKKENDPQSILDIGACLGYFTRELARDGHNVHAIDINPEYVDAMVRLEFDDPSGAKYHHQDFISEKGEYDYVICLAVMHHTMKEGCGVEGAKALERLTKKGLFIEIGTDSEDWLKGRDINHGELKKLFDQHTTFKNWQYLGRTRWNTRDVYYVSR